MCERSNLHAEEGMIAALGKKLSGWILAAIREVMLRMAGDGTLFLDRLVERQTFYPASFHALNPVGRENM